MATKGSLVQADNRLPPQSVSPRLHHPTSHRQPTLNRVRVAARPNRPPQRDRQQSHHRTSGIGVVKKAGAGERVVGGRAVARDGGSGRGGTTRNAGGGADTSSGEVGREAIAEVTQSGSGQFRRRGRGQAVTRNSSAGQACLRLRQGWRRRRRAAITQLGHQHTRTQGISHLLTSIRTGLAKHVLSFCTRWLVVRLNRGRGLCGPVVRGSVTSLARRSVRRPHVRQPLRAAMPLLLRAAA